VQCGWLQDRYGLFWQIVPEQLQALVRDPDRDVARRAMEAMFEMVKIDIATVEAAAKA
jgi:predicted 3-demethylubiquinone-9 3-methyltransferase (glyoxalase superfamily)